MAVFVVPTSVSGTALALPFIGADTGAGLVPLQWVVNGFNVTFACFTLVWGSIADVIGRVRAFGLGAGIFAVASVISTSATDIVILDVARGLAGIGGAAIFSCGSAIVSTVFNGQARTRAFALFGTVAGVGISFGPSLSGLLVDGLGWRWIFAVHALALGGVLLFLRAMGRVVPEPQRGGAPVDVLGSALFILAMLLLTCGIVQGSQWEWTSPAVVGLLAGAAVVLALFVAVERRRDNPVLDLSLLANRRFLALSLVPVAGSFGFITMLTYLPTYLTTVGGHSGSMAGLLMVLLTAPMLICPLIAAKLVSRGVPVLAVIYASLLLLVVGVTCFTLFGAHMPVAAAALPMLLTGVGMALTAGLVDGAALEMVAPEKAGMAAGLLNTLRLGSEAVAVAAYGSLLATFLSSAVSAGIGAFAATGDPAGVAGDVAAGDLDSATRAVAPLLRGPFTGFLISAYDSAFHDVVWVLAAICLLILLAVAALLRTGGRRTEKSRLLP
ncbi:MFS transporter [Nonomuraea lactucae]|uniref:MFS transporter n=1 Tax=Nonomuraea lactucae TaxID=2249762 RepID=UPI001F060E0D|nr:MFS transporter [Nonomuraea lactucae]